LEVRKARHEDNRGHQKKATKCNFFINFTPIKRILLLLIISPLFCFSQHDHDEENHSHEDHSHNNEFAIGLGVIPEHENALGIHAHYIKGIGLNNKFGAGISFETILDDHEHH